MVTTSAFSLRRFAILVAGAACAVTFSVTAYAQGCPVNTQPCNGQCINERALCILEPLPGGPSSIPPGGIGLQTFFYYVNNGVWQWAFRMGVAIAVLNGVVGGFQMVMSNGDSGKMDAGKKRFIGSAMGLILLLLSATILQFLNPIGFQAA